MPNHDEIGTLVAQLRNYQTRSHARQRLQALGDAVVPALLSLVENSEEPDNARWAAITLLGNLKSERAVSALIKILREELSLRGEARRALETITGQEIGEDPDAWDALLTGDSEGNGDPEAACDDGQVAETTLDDAGKLELCQNAVGDVATQLSWEDEEGAGYVYIRLPIEGGRKQQMIVTFDESNEDEGTLLTIYTECGAATPDAGEIVARRNTDQLCGKFMVEGAEDEEQKVVMRHQLPCLDLSPDTLRTILLDMAKEADALEFEITQCDRI